MPDGDGKKIIAAKCQLCHTLERVVPRIAPKDDWQSVIDLIVEQGAALSDDETEETVDRLSCRQLSAQRRRRARGIRCCAAGASGAAPAGGAAPTMIIDPDQTQFNAAPDSLGLPSGTTMATVSGDSGKPGLFSILLKFPPAPQMVRPHWMSTDVDLVVLRGTFSGWQWRRF